MRVAAIIAAGGRGRRVGAEVPKQFLLLAGKPILQWSVEAFLACERVTQVAVVVPPHAAEAVPAYLRAPRVLLVPGGARRQDSVANGFAALAPDIDVVLIHDAARPLVDAATIERAIEAAFASGAAIAAIPASDTVKWSGQAGPAGGRFVERTLDRDGIYLAQTPQAFRRSVLAEAVALGQGGLAATDEASLAERAGHRVQLVDGSRRNIKITTGDDLVIAEALVAEDAVRPGGNTIGRMPAVRVGAGYDLHRLVEGRPLVIGGITIPHERGLRGHSDADVLLHAVTDALLGAAALGDIGQHFPDTDPRWEGASSLDLLARTVAMVRERGFELVNLDATVVAERPRLGPHRGAIVERLAQVLAVSCDAISLKAKTNEGVDAIGRGEAIAAHAVVLLARRAAVGGTQPADHGLPE